MDKRSPFEHPALLYTSAEDFLGFMVPFVREGLDDGDSIFVAARGDNLAALHAEIGARGDAARWADTEEWCPHPATRLRAFHELVTDELDAGATRLRLVGEPVWPAGEPELVLEWQRYESALNCVLAPFPVTLACLYDAARLDPSVVAGARRTHPLVSRGRPVQPSREFEEPERLLLEWAPELSPPPPRATRVRDVVDLSAARRFVERQARVAGVERERAMDLCIAANEALTNALVYGSGAPVLLTWREEDRFLCQVENRGDGFNDALAGYVPPSADVRAGRGLWLAQQLVDLLQIEPASDGTTVRLHMLAG